MDTIVALATPLGRSGIGVIRLSGCSVIEIVRKLTGDENFCPKPRFAYLKKILNFETQEVLDEVLITYFQTPQSFTGEDVIEISPHGSPVIIRQIIEQCLKLNARTADAGEFTLRALANGRMNLSQAEAVRDLIDAQSLAAARQSIRQMHGELSHQLQPLKESLLNIIIILESSIEFVEDDLPEFQIKKIKADLQTFSNQLGELAATFKSGKLLREGLRVVLAGRPNVGKSSLFNTLIGLDRAIVTEVAGTTRDQLHEKFTVNGIPISLIDTAGIRQTSDFVETIGVERSRRAMIDADLVIVLLDGTENLTDEDLSIIEQVEQLNHLLVINKCDLELSEFDILTTSNTLKISAKTGEGIEKLRAAIVEPFSSRDLGNAGFMISDARHFDLLTRAKSEIENSILMIGENLSEEFILIGLHNSLNFLGEITGETTSEEMLTKIFSTFCIGK